MTNRHCYDNAKWPHVCQRTSRNQAILTCCAGSVHGLVHLSDLVYVSLGSRTVQYCRKLLFGFASLLHNAAKVHVSNHAFHQTAPREFK